MSTRVAPSTAVTGRRVYSYVMLTDDTDRLTPGTVPAAVLFDMDGTLVDTEPYWIAAEYRLVAEYGGQWSDHDAHAVIGNALLDTAQYVRDVGGVDLDPAVIVEKLIDDVADAVRREVPWRPGAVELLAECRARDVPAAMVTMSYARLADLVVTAAPPGAFRAVVTGDQVTHGKPHPEAYATACERLGVAPADTVAIEDSPTGARSAQAAGCPVVAVPHRVDVPAGPGRAVVPTLAGLDLAELARLARGVQG